MNETSDPIHFISQERTNEEGRVFPIGWYFYNETWSYSYGPYPTKEKCQQELIKYAENL